MMDQMLSILIIPTVISIFIASYLFFVRRTLLERLLIADLIGMLMIGLIILIAIQEQREFLVDVALVLSALSFIATVAFARTITNGRVI